MNKSFNLGENKCPIFTSESLVIVIFLICGSLLRLIWPGDMNWQADEIWMYERASKIAAGEDAWSWVGMSNSAGFPNPGLSLWVFMAIAFFSQGPLGMVQGVQWLNVVTIWLFFLSIVLISPARPKTWLWGVALLSVSPLAVVYSRAIWASDVLVPFTWLFFLGHWWRSTRPGAFLWGFIGILLGQVHMSGFFLAAGVFLYTVLVQFWRREDKGCCWLAWGLGSGVGFLPLIPWLQIMSSLPDSGGGSKFSLVGVLVPKYFFHWFTTSLGVNLSQVIDEFFWVDFLQLPIIAGFPSYFMLLVHLVLLAVGLGVIYLHWPRRGKKWTKLVTFDSEDKAGDFYLKASGIFVGAIYTILGVNVDVYYLTIAGPFIYLWLARSLEKRTKLLFLVTLLQLSVTTTFLIYSHQVGCFPDSRYSMSYKVATQGLSCQPY